MANMGRFLQRMREYEKADEDLLAAYQGMSDLPTLAVLQVLHGRESLLGAKDRIVLETANALGEIYYVLTHYKEAEKYSRRAFCERQTLLTLRHPETLMSASNLSKALKGLAVEGNKDLFTESERLADMALEGMRNILGVGHLDTLYMLWSKADLKKVQGSLHEAHQLLAQVPDGLEGILGSDHLEYQECL